MTRFPLLAFAIVLVMTGCPETKGPAPATGDALAPAPAAKAAVAVPDAEAAGRLAERLLVLDGHVDLPHRLWDTRADDDTFTEDVSVRTDKGDFDYVRAKEGGLDAPFMSIYVPSKLEKKGAFERATALIGMVDGIIKKWPDKFAPGRTPDEVEANFKKGLISLPMGMENGAPIEGKLSRIATLHALGIRYITLAHAEDNHISDSSYDERHTHKGLSPFGKKVVAEMNRVGVMIDISHISDDAARQVLELSQAPVIASHSSCRKFTPGWERNISDDLIRKVAGNEGVVQVNFGSTFLDDEIRKDRMAVREKAKATLAAQGLDYSAESSKEARKAFYDAHYLAHPRKFATVKTVADHIDHIRTLVGVEHVGLGSDYDGVGDSLPTGLKHPGELPNLFGELLARGWSEDDLAKLASGNVLRVWRDVIAQGAKLQAAQPTGAAQ